MIDNKTIEDIMTHYTTYVGQEPRTPEDVVNYYVYSGRCHGKTQVMVNALPDDGEAIIMVYTLKHKDNIIRRIHDLRPGYPIKKLKFVSYQNYRVGKTNGVRGYRRPIYIDNDVFDMLQYDFLKGVNNDLNRPSFKD